MDIEKQTTEILKFKNGKFILEEVSSSKLRSKLSKDPRWEGIANDAYITQDLGAAANFRQLSDELTSKLFNQTFQSHYEVPLLPQLSLDPHQVEGIRWVLGRKRSYLAHAPGAGKTVQAIIASCLSEGSGQVLFIVPPSLTLNWEREIYRFAPWVGNYSSVSIVPTSDREYEMDWTSGFIICPDSMMTKPWVYTQLLKMNKKFIAIDEASRFKDHQAERSLAFYGGVSKGRVFFGLFQKVRHVVFLDGSPMPNRPIELWAPSYALHPESIDCRDYNDFGYRYCGAKPNDRGQWEYLYSSNEEELKQKLQKDFMHVVTEGQLIHPERLRSMVVMNEDVRSVEHKKWDSKNLGKYTFNGEENSRGDLARFRQELGLHKVSWIANYVKERIKEKNESILLFAWHKDVIQHLTAYLLEFNPGKIVGGTAPRVREHLFSEFQKGNRKLLILNISAAGRGHNLQKADRVIFGEFSWTDEINKQAEKRASRRGSKKRFVRCEYIVCPNSVDEMVLNSVFGKERRVKKIIG